MTSVRTPRRWSPLIFVAILLVASAASLVVAFSPYLFVSHDVEAVTLSASLNSTEIGQNQTLKVTITDTNTLRLPNELPLAGDWRVQNLSLGACVWPNEYPFGIAVFQGRFGMNNISSAGSPLPPAPTFLPGAVFSCPSAARPGNSVKFEPLQSISFTEKISGYYTTGFTPVQGLSGGIFGVHHPFAPGAYTLAAGDEWGHVELLTFQVTGPPIEPVQVISVAGPNPPFNPGGPVVSVTLRNIGQSPITSLNASLPSYPGGPTVPYSFAFDVNSSSPLESGQTAQATRTMIGFGFSTGQEFPLTISGTLLNGKHFSFAVQVQITPPG